MLNIAMNDLKGIIYTINQYYSYPEFDFSPLFYLGINRDDIVALNAVIAVLRAEPYAGVWYFSDARARNVINKLGGIQRLKEALALEDYTFSQFLADKHFDEKAGMCLPYQLFLTFAPEIRRSYMSDDVMLASTLCVELSGGLRVQSIPLPDRRHTRIPISNKEAAYVATMLFNGQYQFKKYDESTSLLSLLCTNEMRSVDIEVRCNSSQLIHHQYPALCVDDDLPEHSTVRSRRKIVSFSQRILPLLQR
jgi:hypothetical protein